MFTMFQDVAIDFNIVILVHLWQLVTSGTGSDDLWPPLRSQALFQANFADERLR